MTEYGRFWIALLVLALLTPIGLYLPEIYKAGSAWGEWGLAEVKSMVGYVPAGMERESGRWKAPLPDYAPPGHENASLHRLGVYYILSAIAGIAACGAGGYLLTRWMGRRKR